MKHFTEIFKIFAILLAIPFFLIFMISPLAFPIVILILTGYSSWFSFLWIAYAFDMACWLYVFGPDEIDIP